MRASAHKKKRENPRFFRDLKKSADLDVDLHKFQKSEKIFSF